MASNWSLHKKVLSIAWKIDKKLFFRLVSEGWRVFWDTKAPTKHLDVMKNIPDRVVGATELHRKLLMFRENWQFIMGDQWQTNPRWIEQGHPNIQSLDIIIVHELAHITLDSRLFITGIPGMDALLQALLPQDTHDTEFCQLVKTYYERLQA